MAGLTLLAADLDGVAVEIGVADEGLASAQTSDMHILQQFPKQRCMAARWTTDLGDYWEPLGVVIEQLIGKETKII